MSIKIFSASAIAILLLSFVPAASAGPATDASAAIEPALCMFSGILQMPCTALRGDPVIGQGRPCSDTPPYSGDPVPNYNYLLWTASQQANDTTGGRVCASTFDRAYTIATGVDIILGAV